MSFQHKNTKYAWSRKVLFEKQQVNSESLMSHCKNGHQHSTWSYSFVVPLSVSERASVYARPTTTTDALQRQQNAAAERQQ